MLPPPQPPATMLTAMRGVVGGHATSQQVGHQQPPIAMAMPQAVPMLPNGQMQMMAHAHMQQHMGGMMGAHMIMGNGMMRMAMGGMGGMHAMGGGMPMTHLMPNSLPTAQMSRMSHGQPAQQMMPQQMTQQMSAQMTAQMSPRDIQMMQQ